MDYIHGWYHYADGTDKQFRYPSDKSDDLRQDGAKVTVEITEGGGKWSKRTGIVVWGGGNYTVIPTPASLLGSVRTPRKAEQARINGGKGDPESHRKGGRKPKLK